MVMILAIAQRQNFPKGEVVSLREAAKICLDAFWGLLTMFIILGGILSGVFTPTESAAVACIYAFIITMFVYRDYKWRDLPLLVARVVRTVGMVMMLIGFAGGFGYMMALMRLPAQVTEFFLSVTSDKYLTLLLINIMLLMLGCLMDMAPLIIICTPILLPVAISIGVDPIHFGMIMLVNLGIGLITPPVGATLFVGCAVGKVPMGEMVRAIWPFYLAMLGVLALVTYVPFFSLWLPSLLKF
jgi:TRAP-type C4-dicarboxylate transport system, large permease component